MGNKGSGRDKGRVALSGAAYRRGGNDREFETWIPNSRWVFTIVIDNGLLTTVVGPFQSLADAETWVSEQDATITAMCAPFKDKRGTWAIDPVQSETEWLESLDA